MARKLVEFLGAKVDVVTLEDAIDRAHRLVGSGRYHYQISLNVATLMWAQKDARLLRIINQAGIVNADGMPIHVAAKCLSSEATRRMGGLDYMHGLGERYPEHRYFFLGATPEVLEKTVDALRERHGMNIVGSHHGYYSSQEWPGVLKKIEDAGTEILFIALGTPEKEYLLEELAGNPVIRFAVGVGGAFDVVAGKTRRAPEWVQRIGMEWLMRLLQEPRRMWKRYLTTNSLFCFLVLKEIARHFRDEMDGGQRVEGAVENETPAEPSTANVRHNRILG